VRRIVAIHTGAVGDLVQSLPALLTVRRAWPGARVTLLGRPQRAVLAREAGVADEVCDIETSGLWAVLAQGPGEPAGENRPLPPPARGPARGAGNEANSTAPHAAQPQAAGAADLPSWLAEADLVLDFLSKGALAHRLASGGWKRQVVTVEPLPPPDWNRSAAEFLARQVRRALGLSPAGADEVPTIPLKAPALARTRQRLAGWGVAGAVVVIHPGSGSVRKNWPLERFEQIARRIRAETGRGVIWLAGPAEVERGTLPRAAGGRTPEGEAASATRDARRGEGAGEVQGARPFPRLAPEAAPEAAEGSVQRRRREAGRGAARKTQVRPGEWLAADLTLPEVAALCALADAYLGNDSGITQIAAAVRTPDAAATAVVALFGPTDPAVWAPRGPHVEVVRSPDGRMESITVEAVWAALRKRLP